MKILKIIVICTIFALLVISGVFFFEKNGISISKSLIPRTKLPFTPNVTPISVPAVLNLLSGKIVDLKKQSITLRISSLKIQPNQSNSVAKNMQIEEKDYKVAITSNTQVFKLSAPGKNPIPKQEIASVDDLKKDMKIIVHADTDITTTDRFITKYIEIISPP